jgi:TonB family protein
VIADCGLGAARSPFRKTRETRRLVLFVLLSLALHAVGIAGTRIGGRSQVLPGDTERGALHVRLISEPERTEDGMEFVSAEPPEPSPLTPRLSSSPAAPDGVRPSFDVPAPEQWLKASELDERAEPLATVDMPYPAALRDKGVIGRVRLRIFIDEEGAVQALRIESSDPPGLFDLWAKNSWAAIRFKPAIKAGVPVKSQKLLELTYLP